MVHVGFDGGGGRPLCPKTVTTKSFLSHITHWIFQPMMGATPLSQGALRIASMAKGTTQKSYCYTTPGANTTHTLCARPRLACFLPSASLTCKLHEQSINSPAAISICSLRKLWLAPLSIRVIPDVLCPVLLANYRSTSSNLCCPAIPTELPMCPSMGC